MNRPRSRRKNSKPTSRPPKHQARRKDRRSKSSARPQPQAPFKSQAPRPARPAPNRVQEAKAPSSGPLHWREGLAPLLAHPNYQPLDAQALARKLHVPPQEASDFTAFLAEEEKAGRVMLVRHSLYVLPKR